MQRTGFQMLNDDEIVTSVQEESDPVDDETDEDKDNNSRQSNKGLSNADAFSALETAMGWYEQRQSAVLLNYCCSKKKANQKPCSENTKVYNGTVKNK
ncbi:uncharacterized protein TNCV_3880621 [Trichonephila clavipes]|nr:uncharacterized protein TNCV_3880621 [Trichonephila clavipes]